MNASTLPQPYITRYDPAIAGAYYRSPVRGDSFTTYECLICGARETTSLRFRDRRNPTAVRDRIRAFRNAHGRHCPGNTA